MNGQVNLKVSLLAGILYSMNFLLTPCTSAAIRKETSLYTPETNPVEYYIFCNYTEFSAAFLGPEYAQYYFSKKIYQVKGATIKQFSKDELFPNCPYYVDAMVYSKLTTKAYIFKGHEVFIYHYYNKRFHFLKHKIFGRNFPNIPESAFTYNGNIYLLKNNYLYLWSEERNMLVTDHVFPLSVLWGNVPSNIDAVFESRNSNYIYFWKWNMREMIYYQVDSSKGVVVKSGSLKSFFGFCHV